MAELNRLCDSHLPSAALPASGSRGRPPIGTSQPSGSPALSREATTTKIEVNRVKALLVICKKIAGRPIFAKATTWQALPPLQQHSMFRQNVPNSQNRFGSKAFGLCEKHFVDFVNSVRIRNVTLPSCPSWSEKRIGCNCRS